MLTINGGVVGQGALNILYALGAQVTVMDINPGLLRQLEYQYQQRIDTMYCTQETIASVLPQMDMVINCVKWPKQRKDFLIIKEMLKLMEPGSVLVDISNDDPGAIESSHETHHDNPRYVVNGVVHYCVSNIPGAAAHSTSVALAGETLPLLLNIMNNGLEEACVRDGFILPTFVISRSRVQVTSPAPITKAGRKTGLCYWKPGDFIVCGQELSAKPSCQIDLDGV